MKLVTPVIFAWGMMGLAAAGAQADPADGAVCGRAGAAAERAAALPANLLLSVGIVESGRREPGGGIAPWPWTVNVDGAGHFFDSKDAAVAYAAAARADGAGDVDVGCFQMSLRYHPEAFASLDQSFDPAVNAAAAAAFLGQLRRQTGSWPAAVADYHSAVAAYGLPYQRRVLAAWRVFGDAPMAFDLAAAALPDLVVIKLAPRARLVLVYSLDDPPDAGLRPGLPRVISP